MMMEQSSANLTKAVALNPLSTELADQAGYTCALMRNLEESNAIMTSPSGSDRTCRTSMPLRRRAFFAWQAISHKPERPSNLLSVSGWKMTRR
jgi:hypothetical protein